MTGLSMNATQPDAPQGLLLFAHGARDPRWAEPFEAVARLARAASAQRTPRLEVALSFLEFMTPGLLDAGRALAAQGCRRVDVVPLFLGAGGHVRKDLPALMANLQAEHPAVTWVLQPAVGEHADVVGAMAAVALNATLLPAPLMAAETPHAP